MSEDTGLRDSLLFGVYSGIGDILFGATSNTELGGIG